jgi:hypothetical protein
LEQEKDLIRYNLAALSDLRKRNNQAMVTEFYDHAGEGALPLKAKREKEY